MYGPLEDEATLKKSHERRRGRERSNSIGLNLKGLRARSSSISRLGFQTITTTSSPSSLRPSVSNWPSLQIGQLEVKKYRTLVDRLDVDYKSFTQDEETKTNWKTKCLRRNKDSLLLMSHFNQLFETLTAHLDHCDFSEVSELLTSLIAREPDLVNNRDLKVPVIEQEKTMFAIEPEDGKFMGSYSMNIVNDLYQLYFASEDHLVYSVTTSDPTPQKYLFCLLTIPTIDGFRALKITKRGHEQSFYNEFSLLGFADNPSGFQKQVLKYFSSLPEFEGHSLRLLKSAKLKESVAAIETNSPQTKSDITAAIICAQAGQTNPHAMFKNAATPAFNTFLRNMNLHQSDKDINRSKLWKHVSVTWYVAPQLCADEHRRDVGNAPSIIFFVEEGAPFSAADIGSLGMVPQIFVVVQPATVGSQEGWRVGFFSSGNMRPYGPALPSSCVFVNHHTLRNFIMTKIHNGNVNFYYSSPMNRRFLMMRQQDIDTVIDTADK
eukprot:TRINITY_DN4319_c0_g1_i1.p1 TRINITY_DN4319_c0_g1~~TRINITY_DN4319_c0_g1_i1.p1  ORF type:complete len:492 (+),score=74.65 TRINITY_DN4319_c0_g1_i1:157-1632(+)